MRTEASSVSSSNGFSRKSTAPSFIASTASGTSPWPVITITGSDGAAFVQAAQQLHAVDLGHAHVGDDAAAGYLRQRLEEGDRRIVGVDLDVGGAQQERQRIRGRRRRRR